jgi:hypothetical protein
MAVPVEIVVVVPAGAEVSVVIPSRDGSRGRNVPRLVEALQGQGVAGLEVIIVTGERPNGHARHLGAAQATGDILVFIDDDACFDAGDTLQRLVEAVRADVTIGLAGVAQRLPPELSGLRRWVATQLPRTESEVVSEMTDSDMVTTLCVAIRRDFYVEIGGMNTWMITGVDPELRQRVRRAGRHVVVVPSTWAYHPVPVRLDLVLRYAFTKGMYSAWQYRFARDLSYDCPEGHEPDPPGPTTLPQRVLRKGLGLVTELARGRPVRILHDLAYSCGYLAGLRRRWPEHGDA